VIFRSWATGTESRARIQPEGGVSSKDNRLPRFFYGESLPPHNTVISISDEEMDRTVDF